mgnify:CR=1 FL=1
MSWIGVDLDGTLARDVDLEEYDPLVVGDPVPAMVARVQRWIAEGREVRVVTARVAPDGTPERMEVVAGARAAIRAWCLRHVGVALPATCVKDQGMLQLWDDRAVQVERNTGESSLDHVRKQRDIAHRIAHRLPLCPDHRDRATSTCVTCERDEIVRVLRYLRDHARALVTPAGMSAASSERVFEAVDVVLDKHRR